MGRIDMNRRKAAVLAGCDVISWTELPDHGHGHGRATDDRLGDAAEEDP